MFFGVFCTACLVLYNRYLLQYAAEDELGALKLTFLHQLSACIITRASVRFSTSVPKWLPILIAFTSATSVFSSNLVLQETSVTFHQMARVCSIPAAALVDFYVKRKLREPLDIFLLVVIGGASMVASAGFNSVTPNGIIYACLFISSYICTAVIVRHTSQTFKVTSPELIGLVVPYAALVSGITLALMIFVLELPIFPTVNMSLEFSVNLILNCSLAVLVQLLSTWTMNHFSVATYAVLGQVKTISTICFAVVFFGEHITVLSTCAFFLVFTCALLLVARESGAEPPCTLRFHRWRAAATFGFFLGCASIFGCVAAMRASNWWPVSMSGFSPSPRLLFDEKSE